MTIFERAHDADIRRELPAIDIPTLLLYGEKDVPRQPSTASSCSIESPTHLFRSVRGRCTFHSLPHHATQLHGFASSSR